MPTVPMFIQHPQPTDASHGVFAPGGYEWWRFEAEDHPQNLRIVADFFDGYPFHEGYIRDYRRYRKRPTRWKPPSPGNYPCVSLAVYEREQIISAFSLQFSVGALTASVTDLNLKVGENSVKRDGNIVTVRMRGEEGALGTTGKNAFARRGLLSAELRFRSLQEPNVTELIFAKSGESLRHCCVITDSRFGVEGTVKIERGNRTYEFRGEGDEQHIYGSRPLFTTTGDHLRGRIVRGDDSCTFQLFKPVATEGSWSACVTQHLGGITRTALASDVQRGAASIIIGDVLRLDRPQMTCLTPHGIRLIYEAQWNGASEKAFCEMFTANGRR